MLATGYEFDVLSAVSVGYDGCLLGTGVLIAGMIRRALDAWAAGDQAGAAARLLSQPYAERTED